MYFLPRNLSEIGSELGNEKNGGTAKLRIEPYLYVLERYSERAATTASGILRYVISGLDGERKGGCRGRPALSE